METKQRDMRAVAANARAARTLSKQKRWAEEMEADGWCCTPQEHKEQRWAEEMRAAGWTVIEPEDKTKP